MTENWGIVQGDFGGSYRATAPGLDLSACKAKIKVWRGDTILIDEKPDAGMDVTYDDPDSYCDYVVVDGDFPAAAIVEGKKTTWKVMVEFTKDGFKEHDLGFEWIVTPAPPEAA